MADGSGEKIAARKIVHLTVSVSCSDGYGSRSLGYACISGIGEAALSILLLAAEGDDLGIDKEDLQNIMDMKNRKLAPKLAPANGLYLVSVEY